MKGRGAGGAGGRDQFPPVELPMEVLFLHREFLGVVLRSCGIAPWDVDDVTSEILWAAYEIGQSGRYRPDPVVAPVVALRRLLRAMAWRQASHWRSQVWRRRELSVAEPWMLAEAAPPVDPTGQLDARAVLRVFTGLPAWQREILAVAGDEESLVEYAKLKGCALGTAVRRLRAARRGFARALRGQRG